MTTRRSIKRSGMLLVAGLLMGTTPHMALAVGEGECATGFCGTPARVGGGGGGGGGGSVLVRYTDIGQTYSFTDDSDGDGLADGYDNCVYVANRSQTDSDGDGVGDAC